MRKKILKGGGVNTLLGGTPKGEIKRVRVTYEPRETVTHRVRVVGEESIAELSKKKGKQTKVGRPQTQTKEITKSSQQGTKENETRATFIVNEALLDKLKAVAYWDRVLIKDVINTALEEAVAKHVKKHGAIKPIPKK